LPRPRGSRGSRCQRLGRARVVVRPDGRGPDWQAVFGVHCGQRRRAELRRLNVGRLNVGRSGGRRSGGRHSGGRHSGGRHSGGRRSGGRHSGGRRSGGRHRRGKLVGAEPCKLIELWAAPRHPHQRLETRSMCGRCLGRRYAEHWCGARGIDSSRCFGGESVHRDRLGFGRGPCGDLASSSPALMDGAKLSSCTLYRGNRGRPFTRYSRHGILGHSGANPVPPAPAS
jgi:hypothetical protein